MTAAHPAESAANRAGAAGNPDGARDFRTFVPACRYQPALALSPDGSTVAYSCNRSGQYNLWLHPTAGGDAVRLTDFTDHAVRQAAFSPDGQWLAFTADHHGDEQRQIHLISVDGGEPKALTHTPAQHSLAARPFAPDGSRLAYAANDVEPTRQDLLVADLETQEVRRFAPPQGRLAEPVAFSPDGGLLLVWAMTANTDSDLYTLDTADGSSARLTAHEGEETHQPGPWTTDGSGVYEITDATGDVRALGIRDLTGGLRPVGEKTDWPVEQVAASAAGDTLAWSVNRDGVSGLEVVRDGQPLPLPAVPAGQITALTVSADGRLLAFLLDTASRPAEVCVIDLDDVAFRILTDSRPPALARGEVTAVEPVGIRYATHDGRMIPALLYKPPGDRKVPVVVSVHGGPEDQERPVYRYAGLYQYLLAAGVAVLAPNVRGSTGYGTAYQRLIHRDWGGGELADLEYAVRYLRDIAWVDPERIGVFGASYGGFAALSCLARLPEYWAAGVSVVGPSNLVSFARSVPPTWRPLMARWVGDPELDADHLTQRSPLTYADQIRAPLYVIQGARDPRVVRAESDQVVASLRSRGIPVRYDVFEDEGHGFTKRENEIRAWTAVGDFLIQNLG